MPMIVVMMIEKKKGTADLVDMPLDLDAKEVQEQRDAKADRRKKDVGVGEVAQAAEVRGDKTRVNDGKTNQEDADAGADADFQNLGDPLDDFFANSEQAQQNENDAADHEHAHADLPGANALRDKGVGQNGVGAPCREQARREGCCKDPSQW